MMFLAAYMLAIACRLILQFQSIFIIHWLRYFYIVAGAIVHAFAGMGLAGIAAAAFHFFAAGVALGKVLVAFGVGAVYHFIGNRTAVKAGRYYYRVHTVHINGKAIVEHVAFAFKILAAGFFSVFYDAAM